MVACPPTDIDERIRRRAYESCEERGRVDGFALEDWLQGEAEVTDGQSGERIELGGQYPGSVASHRARSLGCFGSRLFTLPAPKHKSPMGLFSFRSPIGRARRLSPAV